MPPWCVCPAEQFHLWEEDRGQASPPDRLLACVPGTEQILRPCPAHPGELSPGPPSPCLWLTREGQSPLPSDTLDRMRSSVMFQASSLQTVRDGQGFGPGGLTAAQFRLGGSVSHHLAKGSLHHRGGKPAVLRSVDWAGMGTVSKRAPPSRWAGQSFTSSVRLHPRCLEGFE